MTLIEARMIGMSMLNMDKRVFDKAKAVCDERDVAPNHMGPMTLAFAIMGLARAVGDSDKIRGELTDALALVAKAEKQWRLQQKMRMQ